MLQTKLNRKRKHWNLIPVPLVSLYLWISWQFFCIAKEGFSALKKKNSSKEHFECGIWMSLRKQPTFGDATTGFPAKWTLRNEYRNSILMTCHYPDLGSAFDWLNQISHASRPTRSAIQIWVVTRHQYGISALVSQTSFGGETSGCVTKCRLFSQAHSNTTLKVFLRTVFFF